MNWIESLCELYRKNKDVAGVYKKGRYQEDLLLIPIYHSTFMANITVYINTDGEFTFGERVGRDNRLTIMPVTEESAVRTSNCSPHPLCDGLKYVSGDYLTYVDVKSPEKISAYYKEYMRMLHAWAESDYGHPKLDAISRYLEKGVLVQDLIQCGCLTLDETGKLSKDNKIGTIAQEDAAVRFVVLENEVADLAEGNRDFPEDEACWKDRILQKQWISYCRAKNDKEEKVLSYGTGNMVRATYNNPSKIRNDGDSGKLISFGDKVKKNHFLLSGRMKSEEESVQLGYEEMQMAYNALKWIIRKQGFTYGDLCGVFYISGEGDAIPGIADDTEGIRRRYESIQSADTLEEADAQSSEEEQELPDYEIVQRDAAKFTNAMLGYGKLLDPNSQMKFMAFKGATPGRLAIVEDHTIRTGDYLEKIRAWHRDMSFLQMGYGGDYYYGSFSTKAIALILHGDDHDRTGRLSLRGRNTDMEQYIAERLIDCILYGDPLPEDIVHRAIWNASRPQTYTQWYNWEKALSFACACVQKKTKEKNMEGVGVALRTDCTDRSYLYGRLLAIADRMEYRSFRKDETRNTNAKKYMTAFAIHPFRTWTIIEQKTAYCLKKLGQAEALRYQHMIDQIMGMFEDGDYESQDALDGMYLLGYHNQAMELRNSYIKNKKEEVEENE